MKNLSLFALRAAAVLAMTATMVACSDNDPEKLYRAAPHKKHDLGRRQLHLHRSG